MSFSNDVKVELASINADSIPSVKAELFGILKTGGAIVIRQGRISIEFVTDKPAVTRHIIKLLKVAYTIKPVVSFAKNIRLKKNNIYKITLPTSIETNRAIEELKLMPLADCFDFQYLKKREEQRAFLRGVFLAKGSITSPNVDYHVDIIFNDEKMAELTSQLLDKFFINAKTILYNDGFLVYIQKFEDIVEFLNVIGACGSMLDLENFKIVKEIRNTTNRIVNCETANLNKTVNAALKQIECIKYIDNNIGLSSLDSNLQEACRIRLEHPQDSLSELVEHFDGIGKSGINHRLKRVCKIAQSLGFKSM